MTTLRPVRRTIASPAPRPEEQDRSIPLPGGGREPRPGTARPELLVALRSPADLTGTLVRAAARARAEDRPISAVVVEPARRWTIDAAVVAVQDRRRHREIASMAGAARAISARAGVALGDVTVLRPARAWTRAGRDRRVEAQLAALAHHRGAELHPAPSGRATSGPGATPSPRPAAPRAGSIELPVGAR